MLEARWQDTSPQSSRATEKSLSEGQTDELLVSHSFELTEMAEATKRRLLAWGDRSSAKKLGRSAEPAG
jgi:hypothetical protein